jgi:AraC family transcriptional regulator
MGTPGQIPDGWEWEPRAALEIYDEDFAVDPATGRFPCWLCIPVQRTR